MITFSLQTLEGMNRLGACRRTTHPRLQQLTLFSISIVFLLYIFSQDFSFSIQRLTIRKNGHILFITNDGKKKYINRFDKSSSGHDQYLIIQNFTWGTPDKMTSSSGSLLETSIDFRKHGDGETMSRYFEIKEVSKSAFSNKLLVVPNESYSLSVNNENGPRFGEGLCNESTVKINLYDTEEQEDIHLESELKELECISDEDYLQRNLSVFQHRPYLINTFIPKILIQSYPACPENGPFLLVAVPSVADHRAQREAIRNTWGGLAYGQGLPRAERRNYDVRLVFFLGLQGGASELEVMDESSRHGDLVMANFMDSYRNLSLKMAFVLHWSTTYCSHVQHVLKVDEDTFVNLPLLLDLLHAVSQRYRRFILGHKYMSHRPPVVRKGMWAVKENDYPLPYFPQYLYGHSYVISGQVLPDLYFAFQHMPLVPCEDSFVTGILAKTAGITRIHSGKFAVLWIRERCSLVEEKYFSQTNFKDISELYAVWDMFKRGRCS